MLGSNVRCIMLFDFKVDSFCMTDGVKGAFDSSRGKATGEPGLMLFFLRLSMAIDWLWKKAASESL
jgi:hypothetical protein